MASGDGEQLGQPGIACLLQSSLEIFQRGSKVWAGEPDFEPQQSVVISAKDWDAAQFIHIVAGVIAAQLPDRKSVV